MSDDDLKIIRASLDRIMALASKPIHHAVSLECATIFKLVEASHAQARR